MAITPVTPTVDVQVRTSNGVVVTFEVARGTSPTPSQSAPKPK